MKEQTIIRLYKQRHRLRSAERRTRRELRSLKVKLQRLEDQLCYADNTTEIYKGHPIRVEMNPEDVSVSGWSGRSALVYKHPNRDGWCVTLCEANQYWQGGPRHHYAGDGLAKAQALEVAKEWTACGLTFATSQGRVA